MFSKIAHVTIVQLRKIDALQELDPVSNFRWEWCLAAALSVTTHGDFRMLVATAETALQEGTSVILNPIPADTEMIIF